MWEFEFEATVGTRILRNSWAITTYGPNSWYGRDSKVWGDNPKGYCSTHKDCHTFKAFKRHLRKHPELQGQKVVLVARWSDHDIIATYKETV